MLPMCHVLDEDEIPGLVSGLITERGVLQSDSRALARAFPERAGSGRKTELESPPLAAELPIEGRLGSVLAKSKDRGRRLLVVDSMTVHFITKGDVRHQRHYS
jgi:hypothetical protein